MKNELGRVKVINGICSIMFNPWRKQDDKRSFLTHSMRESINTLNVDWWLKKLFTLYIYKSIVDTKMKQLTIKVEEDDYRH
jgi:hypothetical protein